ncbi:TPA: hypothetical protein ACH3X1_004305 [Trebouxia sp. C0004]
MSCIASFSAVQLRLLPKTSHNGDPGCVAILQTPAAQHELLPAERIVQKMMTKIKHAQAFPVCLMKILCCRIVTVFKPQLQKRWPVSLSKAPQVCVSKAVVRHVQVQGVANHI